MSDNSSDSSKNSLYEPSEEESSDEISSGDEEEDIAEPLDTKKRRNASNKNANQSKKQKRVPMKSKNHNDFFEKHLDAEPANNTLNLLPVDQQIQTDSNLGPIDTVLPQINNETSFQQLTQDMRELKDIVMDLKRHVARVEVLIKCQKSSVLNKSNENCMEVLQSFGLPIMEKSKLDELEKSLANKDNKARLVSGHIFRLKFLGQYLCFIYN